MCDIAPEEFAEYLLWQERAAVATVAKHRAPRAPSKDLAREGSPSPDAVAIES